MERIQISQFAQASPFHGGLRAALTRIVTTGIAVFLAVAIVPGIEAATLTAGVAAVLVLTFLNLILRPILLVLTLPLIVLSLGLFLVVVNALLLRALPLPPSWMGISSPTSLMMALMAGSLTGLPAKAPFRSTRCRRRAPASTQRRAIARYLDGVAARTADPASPGVRP